MVESIVGCKWSMHVLAQIRSGVCRPGALVRSTDGLTPKVLNERLSKMLRFGILDKRVYPQIPPRVEYIFTPFGERFLEILDGIERLKQDAAAGRIRPRDQHPEPGADPDPSSRRAPSRHRLPR